MTLEHYPEGAVDEAPWGEWEPFRESVIYTLGPAQRRFLQDFGEHIFELALEAFGGAEPLAEPPIRARLRAAATDLTHLKGSLVDADREQQETDPQRDLDLRRLALQTARQFERIAGRIGRRIGSPPRAETGSPG